MPIPDFFSPDDSVKYLKNFEENTDSYLAALDYVKERVFGEGTMLDEFNADTLDALCKLTNKLIEDTNYSFAQTPRVQKIEQINSKVFYLENFRPEK